MIVPDEFNEFTLGFFQGGEREFPTICDWIRFAVRRLDVQQRIVVKKFISDLLDGNKDEAELQSIWNNSSADFFISGDNGARNFFKMIRDEF
jgi:hypothetical protein